MHSRTHMSFLCNSVNKYTRHDWCDVTSQHLHEIDRLWLDSHQLPGETRV